MTQSIQWKQIDKPQGGAPEQRQGHSMCYDEIRQKVVLFGGFESEPRVMHDETLEWDGREWVEIGMDPYNRPLKRFLSAMAYDPIRKKIVLYGYVTILLSRCSITRFTSGKPFRKSIHQSADS